MLLPEIIVSTASSRGRAEQQDGNDAHDARLGDVLEVARAEPCGDNAASEQAGDLKLKSPTLVVCTKLSREPPPTWPAWRD